jgi:Epoxide hydrolase N terminus
VAGQLGLDATDPAVDPRGVQHATVQDPANHWATDYDWRSCEAKLNTLEQSVTNIDGLDIHFIHARSPQQDALPVIVSHDWPGSIIKQLKIIDPHTNPADHGGSASDAQPAQRKVKATDI